MERTTSSFAGPGNILTVNWDITFSSSWQAENANIYLRTTNKYSLDTGWENKGDVQIGCILPPPPPSPPPPTVDLKADGSNGPITKNSGDTVTLSWTTTNSPTSCTASDAWTGAKSTSGDSENVVVAADSTFTLTCTNPDGTDSDSVTVDVAEPPPDAAACENKKFIYCYVVTDDRSTFVLWAQLENTRDFEIYDKPSALCKLTRPEDTYFNYCLGPPQ